MDTPLWTSLSLSLPELLAALCFVLGYVLLAKAPHRRPAVLSLDYTHLVASALAGGNVERALLHLQDGLKTGFAPSLQLCTSLLDACFKERHIDQAFQLFAGVRALPGLAPHLGPFYEALIMNLYRARDLEKALELIREMKASGVQMSPAITRLQVVHVARAGSEQDLQSVLQTGLDAETYQDLVRFYLKSQQLGRAGKVYEDMKKRQVTPTLTTYGHLIDSACRNESLPVALALLEDMQTTGVTPDPPIFASIVRCHCKYGQVEEACGLLVRMLAIPLQADETLFNLLIDGCAKAGKTEKALELFGEMEKAQLCPTTMTFNSLIDASVRAHNMPQAWAFLEDMKGRKHVPDNFTYSTLIKGIKQEGEAADVSQALQLLQDLKSSGEPDGVLYNCILDTCVGAKDLSQAFLVFEEMKSLQLQDSIFRKPLKR